MVLSELGNKLTAALHAMASHSTVGDEELNQMLVEIGNALMTADVNVKLVAQLRNNVKKRVNLPDLAPGLSRAHIIRQAVFDELCELLDPHVPPFVPIKGKPNVLMMVGLQGSGKTTTVTKLARFYKRKGFKPGVICADTFRAGAYAQLRQNATKAQVLFYGSETETDPVKVASDGVGLFKKESSDLIIVDTSGRHKQEEALFEEMESIASSIKPDCIIFVMDASIGQTAHDQAAAFKARVPIGSVIITKLDGHAKGGGALSAVAATQSPIIFLGTGERQEDLDSFTPKVFVKRLLGEGNMKEVIEIVKEVMPKEQQERLTTKLQQGKLTLRDLYEQLQATLQMGPIDKMLQNLPGFSNMPLPKGVDANAKLRGFINIMDSMTAAELDGKAAMTPQRMERIARGSGHPVMEVQLLMEQYKMFTKLSALAKPGSLGRGNIPNMRNIAQLGNKLPPKMLQQMGGIGGLQSLVRQLSNAENGGAGLSGLF
ncbi:signal recognition particle 54 kDa subunit [Pelomyxa schiedti]|nr:signal recognition particle 54 kDa subunit [Pelomyxa schiedti]